MATPSATAAAAVDNLTIDARPYAFTFPLRHTALLVIDMQRDFIEPGGFGEMQGCFLDDVQASVGPTKLLLESCRAAGLQVFHTREGQVPSLADCPSSKLVRQKAAPGNKQHTKVIGDVGPLGRILVRGEYGHDIVDTLQPRPAEVVVDKPGKGSFWNTVLMHKLKARGITHLLVSGVTTECCFSTSIREANDRGFECCGIVATTGGYNISYKTASLDMISWSEGLFGFVAELQPLLDAISPLADLQKSIGAPSETPIVWDGKLDIQSLRKSYAAGVSPVTVVEAVYDRIEKYKAVDPAVWICLEPKENVVAAAKKLVDVDRASMPALFGVPFSVKDSIDVQGIETTVACPPMAYTASSSAACVEKAISQGALYFGKVNLDQFATGLSGCRSPYGIPHSVFSKNHISGGSSSGSCVSVGANLVSFSLGTDTAGSGRVPTCFNGVVGFKPTRGLVSLEGLVPAMLSLDCIAFITQNVADARLLWQICESYDENDRYARDTFPADRHINSIGPQTQTFTFGVPPSSALEACSPHYHTMFAAAISKLEQLGGQPKPVDWAPFEKAGDLLYDGSFVLERLAGLPDDFISKNREQLEPVFVSIMEAAAARGTSAIQAFRDLQAQALYTRLATKQFAAADRVGLDVLVVPTASQHPTIEAMLKDPIKLNSKLGAFTHFGNVLDLCAVAVPAGEYRVDEVDGVLPFSMTFLGARCTDSEVLNVAARFHGSMVETHDFRAT